jgi:hypothetical protein
MVAVGEQVIDPLDGLVLRQAAQIELGIGSAGLQGELLKRVLVEKWHVLIVENYDRVRISGPRQSR